MELIVAITMFVVGILGVLGATARIQGLVSSGDRAATAMLYAQERLEALVVMDCADLTDGDETRGGRYDLRWQIVAPPSGNTRQIDLRVSYPSSSGSTRTDTLETSVLCIV